MVVVNMKQARLKALEIKNLFHYIQINCSNLYRELWNINYTSNINKIFPIKFAMAP